MKRFAFTLAEVLITMAIIGVISALTVPTLIQNHQRKVYVTQLHKVYNDLAQAVEVYMADHSIDSLNESRLRNNKTELEKFVSTYFKTVKNCGGKYYISDSNLCFANSYSSLDGSNVSNLASNECFVTVLLSSGAAMCFDTGNLSVSEADSDVNGDGKVDENDVIQNNGANTGAVMTVEVDVNGAQGPNVAGRDFFYMDVLPNGEVCDSKWTSTSSVDTENAWPIGIGKIMADGWKMTY